VIGTRSIQFEDTERVMGWDISSSGFKIVLSPEIPDLAENGFPPYVREFLSEYDLEARDIRYWIAHPGGPRVIEGIQKGLDLPQEAMALSWESLRSVGNLSSASVLLVLDETLQRYQPEPGAYGLMMALGPGFSAELVLLQW
jgi:alkylresorcinol/alkylpyrone synthase